MSKDWQFREDKPYLEKEIEPWLTDETKVRDRGWATYIIYDGVPCKVSWYSDRKGLKISMNNDNELTEEQSNNVAVLGLTLIKLMSSGARCMKEI